MKQIGEIPLLFTIFNWQLTSQSQIKKDASSRGCVLLDGNKLLETQFSSMTTQFYMIFRDANSKQRRMTAGSDG